MAKSAATVPDCLEFCVHLEENKVGGKIAAGRGRTWQAAGMLGVDGGVAARANTGVPAVKAQAAVRAAVRIPCAEPGRLCTTVSTLHSCNTI